MITDGIEVEAVIVQHLEPQGPCTMEALVHSLTSPLTESSHDKTGSVGKGKSAFDIRVGLPIWSQP